MFSASDTHEKNRQSWNAATIAHNSHKGDQAAFLRRGGDTLFPEELDLLGDLSGRRLVHLQCNAGQDTLCIARRGAACIGVDISDEAISFARKLSADSGIAAEFVRSDIYDWLRDARHEQFDIAFASYGALCWLSDIKRWAVGVRNVLRPGGRLVVMEFHPVLGMFDVDGKLFYDYSTRGAAYRHDVGVSDYVAASGRGLARDEYHAGVVDFKNPHECYEYIWGIGEIISAVLAAGLRLTRFEEYLHCNGCKFMTNMRDVGDDRWIQPEGMPTMPMMYGFVATRE